MLTNGRQLSAGQEERAAGCEDMHCLCSYNQAPLLVPTKPLLLYVTVAASLLQACRAAHADLRPAALSWSEGELLDANINRSPTAYLNNPAAERAQYKHDVDKETTVLRIRTPEGAGR
jgi:hypothetical protein